MATRTPDHVEAGQALEAALRGDPEPTTYQRLLPPPDWGAAKAAGSANIPFIAVVAAYVFGVLMALARARLVSYGAISRWIFMLAEQLSHIYSDWVLLPMVEALGTARERKHQDVIDALDPVIEQWFGLARVMSVRAPRKGLEDDELKYAGKTMICWAGFRCWGHGAGLGLGLHQTLRVASGEEAPKPKRDGESFEDTIRRTRVGILREFYARFDGLTPDQVFEKIGQFSMREEVEFRGWEDGSRECNLGRHEDAFVDSDHNGNTGGKAVVLVSTNHDNGAGKPRGRIWSLPAHPSTRGLLDPKQWIYRLRQTSMFADVDQLPNGGGWRLYHSHLGDRRVGAYYESDAGPEPKSRLIFAWRSSMSPAPGVAGGPWTNLLKSSAGGGGSTTEDPGVPGPGPGRSPSPAPAPIPSPAPPPAGKREKKSSSSQWIALAVIAAVVVLFVVRSCGG